MMSRQQATLADELAKAKLHLRDDYPGECYPADMLWARGGDSARRSARRHANHDELAKGLIAAFDGPLKAAEGLPAFQADSRSGTILQGGRGCGNSGILLFAAELDPAMSPPAGTANYEEGFWKDTGWMAGFTEKPRDSHDGFMDVDSGPVVSGFGSVASAFGIGARQNGRPDRPRRAADDGGRRLFVADALWPVGSGADGPVGGGKSKSRRGSIVILDEQTDVGD